MTEIPSPQKPIRIGMVTGLLGGSLAGAVDGFLCLVDRLASSLPSFPAAADLAKLLAGLALLALPLALGGALFFGLVGATIRLVRPRLRAERQVAFHLFLLVTGMTMLVLLDRVGFDAVIRSGGHTLACLLAGASLVAGWAGWFLFRSLARTWQEGRAPLFRPLRWPAARNPTWTPSPRRDSSSSRPRPSRPGPSLPWPAFSPRDTRASWGWPRVTGSSWRSSSNASGPAGASSPRNSGTPRERCRSPFFLWVHYIDPHSPLDPPAPFKPDLGGLSEKRRAFLASYNGKDILTGIARLEKEDREALVALYDGEIAYVDHCVGGLLDTLDDLGLADDTLVIVTSDHGEEFWDHGGFQHGHTLYDELIRVPLLMRGPGIAKGRRRVREQVRLIDLMPTLLDLAGRPHPPGLKGRSLAPILEGGTGDAPFAFSEGLYLTEEKKAVRGHGWKLIYLPGSGTYELYDLAKDPGEQREVSESRTEVFQRMRSVLLRRLGSGDS